MNFESSEFSFGLRTYSFFALFDAKQASISLNFCSKVPTQFEIGTVLSFSTAKESPKLDY